MNKKLFISLFIFLILVQPIFIVNAKGQTDGISNLELKMRGCEERTVDGKKVMVAGFYHILEFDKNGLEVTEISISRGDQKYGWRYEDGWKGDLSYLNQTSSEVSDFHVKMFIGIEAGSETGEWNLTINGNEFRILVERPVKSIGFHSADFNIRFQPFENSTKSAEPQKFILDNTGNTIFNYKVNFDKYDSRINVSSKEGLLKPNSKVESTVSFTVGKWDPDVIDIDGNILVTPHKVISNSTATLVPQYSYDISLRIYIGHENYQIKKIDQNLGIQFLKKIQATEGKDKVVRFFISGEKSVTVNIETTNIKIISLNGETVDDAKFSLDLSPNTEYPVELIIKPSKNEEYGEIKYILDDGLRKEVFSTEVEILEDDLQTTSENQGYDNSLINFYIIGGGVFFVAIYIILINLKRSKV